MATVLLVEDEVTLRDMYVIMLELKNHKVHLATNGREGIQKAKTLHPDMIFMDMMMPEMNGVDALKELKRDPDTQTIPVIMLSNLADDQQEKETKELGALKYVTKSNCNVDSLDILINESVKPLATPTN